jgi:hypothetical protein
MTSLLIERTGQVDVLDLRGDVLSDPRTRTHQQNVFQNGENELLVVAR